MRHIGVEWRRRHLMFVLESKFMTEKLFRDSFLVNLTDAVTRSTVPLAKDCPHTDLVKRKAMCWRYNMHGLWEIPHHKIPRVDHYMAEPGTPGSRDWVPWLNLSARTISQQIYEGHIPGTRVPLRGYGSCPHMNKGKWEHRWNVTHRKEHLQYTGIS